MNTDIIDKIREIKKEYEKEGFIILGVFGSYARGEESSESDIDILYEMSDSFYNKFKGWEIYNEIDKIENRIKSKLNYKIDLANKNALNEIGKQYILNEVIYV
ncbi:MAG: nucleotidyltransferase domain-containing protein [Spirochaetes bacterium]|nr:nucleotidyltransferase domain-containing protein [Spirochaetota bacterium]